MAGWQDAPLVSAGQNAPAWASAPLVDQGSQTQQPEPNSVVDAIRSIPGGIAKGVSGIVGIPGDISHAMGVAGGFIRKNVLGEDPAKVDAAEAATDRKMQPTTGDVADAVAKPFGGYYQPQTTAGRYAETISSFAPAAAAPGGLATRLARVAIPGAASEAAGQATAGTPIEPYARAIAGMGAGVATGLGEGMLAERAQSRGVPSTSATFKAGSDEYKRIGGTPVALNSQFMDALQGETGKRAIQTALDGAEANREAPLVAELQSLLGAQPPTQLTANAADKISQAFRDMGRGAMRGDEPNANLARGVYGRRSDVEGVLAQVPEIQGARRLWSTAERSQVIDDAIKAATVSGGTPAGFGDHAQAIRREFLKVTRSPEFDGFSKEEQAAIQATANGTLTTNTLQRLGKYSPVRNHLTGLLSLGGAYEGFPVITAAIGAGGEVARQASNFAAARAARFASETVRGGGAAKPMMGQLAARNAGLTSLPKQSSADDSYASKIKRLVSQQ